MTCKVCKRESPLAGRGLCGACYQRWYKRGTTDYAPQRERAVCRIAECGLEAISNGLCDKHRKRLERHGHLDETRPESWGAIEAHPLRNAWRNLQRHRGRQKISPEWDNDFLQFAADIGERPTPAHKLFAANETKPIGPGNFVWKRAITERVEGEDEATFANRRARVYRALSPENYKKYDLKKLYGISRSAYLQLFELQEGRCAICDKEEARVINGKTLSLAVDHCHDTGKIRGLLCMDCNRALGGFRDDPKILRRAIAYLARPLLQHRHR